MHILKVANQVYFVNIGINFDAAKFLLLYLEFEIIIKEEMENDKVHSRRITLKHRI